MSTNEPRKPVDPNAASQRYLFETCFDSDRMVNAAKNEAPEPTFSAEDLQQAREAAFAEGETAGRQDAANSLEKQILNGLGRLVEQMGALTDDQMRFQQDLTERSVELALKATRKMFPALAQRDGLVEIDALLTNCLLEAKEEPRIMVRVSTALAEPFRERIDALATAAGYQGVVTVLPDDAFGPADCRVEWTNGGAERVAAHMWQEFDAATQRIFCDQPDDWGDHREATPEPQLPTDGAISAVPEPDPVMTAADTPDTLIGQPDIDAPAPADPMADPMAEPAVEQAGEPVSEPMTQPMVEPPGETLGEPIETPPMESADEPIDEPIDKPMEMPTRPDDAVVEPDMTPESAQPQQTATAS